MDRATAVEIQRRAFHDLIAVLGAASPGARVFERDGVAGAIVPAVPDRSIVNSVVYRDAGALADAYDELAAAYDEAGIGAWTVWAPEFDAEAEAVLADAGHVIDGTPLAKVLELDRLQAPELGDLDWDSDATLGELGELNDRAYEEQDAGFAPALVEPPDGPPLHLYRARVDGEVACVAMTIDHGPGAGGDCGVYFVATDPAHRGRGLASRLLGVALAAARERGCATSSLQSSALGAPIYERLGYRPYFRFHMYERRRSGG